MNSQRVRLEIHAAKLTNVAKHFSTSDPYAVVTILANDANEQPRVLGKTEVIKNSLNPRWVTHFDIDYCIGKLTRINIGVYDDDKTKELGSHKPMGSAMFEIGQVLGTRGNVKAKQLRNGGTLFVRIKAAPSCEFGTLRLKFAGYQLKNVDGLFGKSDPFFEMSYKVQDAAVGLTWQPVYRSQPIKADLNPCWLPFEVDVGRICGGDYNQPIQVKLYDYKSNGKHSWMGTFETNVNALLAAVVPEPVDKQNVDISKAFSVAKRGKVAAGKVIVFEAQVNGGAASSNQGSITLAPMSAAVTGYVPTAAASAIINEPTSFSPPEQYVPPQTVMPEQYVQPPLQQAHIIHEPSTIFNSQASYLPPPVPIVPNLAAATRPTASVPLPPPEAAKDASSSDLESSDYSLPPPMAPPERKPSFVDYLSGGLEIEMCIAIDFTGSNGDPRIPGTLHYMDSNGRLNDYEKAITAVGSILARYDTNQRFPVWGFGAKFGSQIQHCFQVGDEAELNRIPSVLKAYRNVFQSGLTMSGPTVFAEVIDMAAAKARSSLEAGSRVGRQIYTLLLILTDGEVSDLELTKRALHNASDAPLSVIVVGIGNADFSSMHYFDNFQANAGGKHRDICKFVEFNRYRDDKQALTRETLQEIPDQLTEYFWRRGIPPLPSVNGSQSNVTADAPTDEDTDLNLSFGANGEISLASDRGAIYDDTRYISTIDSMTNGTNLYQTSASPTSCQPQVVSSHNTSQEAGPVQYNPNASIGVAGGPYVAGNAGGMNQSGMAPVLANSAR
ncbi:hypothetical protein MPSEU_000954700 [Mayamaea pseudoterrestris]|nr:hypothetical protein MPSEU_000954700 [Mayamaea pseudoterrestris]